MRSNNNKIKLVQVIAERDAIGGGPKHVLGLLTNIDKENFEVYLICPKGELLKQAKKINSVKTIAENMDSKFNIRTIFRIKKELQKIQAEGNPFSPMIVHSHGPRAGLLARRAQPAGVRSVYTEHIWGPGYHLEDKINEWAQKRVLRSLNNRTNLIIAVSKAVKQYIIDEKLAPENRVIVIPNGITISEKLKANSEKLRRRNYQNQIIGTVGSLNSMKGQVYLIRAMDEVIKQYPHAMAEIVGEGEERENLQREIKELSLERHITLLGKRSNIQEIMAQWSIFVLPSIAETFGITILEAYAAGVPVVASRISGISDLIADKKSGLLVEPEDSAALAKSIIKLLEHPAEAAKLARGGKEKVKEYDWKKVIKGLEEEYFRISNLKTQTSKINLKT